MNYPEIENVIKHLKETCKCLNCEGKFEYEDINVIATTNTEGLFETRCKNCESSTLVTVMLEPNVEIKKEKLRETVSHRIHGNISRNEVLDMKNFLNRFDGDFKKIFTKSK